MVIFEPLIKHTIKAAASRCIKCLGIIVFIYMMLGCGIHILAQDNPYKIKDSSYKIFTHAIKNRKDGNLYLHIIDSLEASAVHEHDLKAQCIAWQMRCGYAGQLPDNKEKEVINIVNKAKEFCNKTPYMQYYFASWNSLVTFYGRHGRTLEFCDELYKCQKEAVKMKDAYGIANSYKMMGNFYLGNMLYNLAVEQFEAGVGYLKSINDKKNIAELYNKLAEAYIAVDEYDKAEEAIDNYFQSEHDKNYEQSPYAMKLLLALKRKESPQEIDKAFNEYSEVIKQRGIGNLNVSRLSYMDFLYYSYKNDEAMTAKIVDDIKKSNYIDKLKFIIPWLIAHKDYKSAVEAYSTYFDYNEKQIQQQFSTLMSVNQVRFGVDRIEMENRELLIRNQNMKLESQQAALYRMDIERQFLLTNREKDSLAINYSIYKQKADSVARAQEVAAARAESRNRSRQLISMFFVLMVVIVSAIIYFIMQRRNSKKLKKEKKISDEARNIAEEAMHEAKRANELKSQFLNNMSHEIRTPLNAIVGFTDIINSEEGRYMEDEEKNELLKLVHTNSELLTTLINDLLDLSRMQTGNYRLALENFNLSHLCKEALASVQHRAPEGVAMEFVPYIDPVDGETDIRLYSDRKRVMQVIINFLTNACKYTEHGSIKLAYQTYLDKENKAWVDISVTDTGIGIPEDKSNDIFNRFEKLDDFKQGTGLGLNICLTISKLLDGRVWLDNSYKTGCRFVFTLPL